MFDNLKEDMNLVDDSVKAMIMLEAVVDAPEDSFLNSIATPTDDDPEIEKLLAKIPDTNFTTNEPITDKDLADADNNVENPTDDELFSDILESL